MHCRLVSGHFQVFFALQAFLVFLHVSVTNAGKKNSSPPRKTRNKNRENVLGKFLVLHLTKIFFRLKLKFSYLSKICAKVVC